jgi:hypothetical protein
LGFAAFLNKPVRNEQDSNNWVPYTDGGCYSHFIFLMEYLVSHISALEMAGGSFWEKDHEEIVAIGESKIEEIPVWFFYMSCACIRMVYTVFLFK